jgi:hypothetical protein
MSFRIHLFLASVSLSRRALRVYLSAMCLRLSRIALGLSKRIGPPPPQPPPVGLSTINSQPSNTPAPQMTVEELLCTAQRYPDPHFVLRMPGLLIEITQVDEFLETIAFNAGSEGHTTPRRERPFFADRRRPAHDKAATQ